MMKHNFDRYALENKVWHIVDSMILFVDKNKVLTMCGKGIYPSAVMGGNGKSMTICDECKKKSYRSLAISERILSLALSDTDLSQ